jgi:hypothetical protein
LSKTRIWLFRSSIIVGIGLLLATWFLPWWRIDVILVNNWAVGHPWGLETDPFVKGFFPTAKMPDWFAPLMFVYLGLIIVLMLLNIFIKDKELHFGKLKFSLHQLLIFGVGVSIIVVAVLAAVVIYIRLQEPRFMGAPFLGHAVIQVDADLHIDSATYSRFQAGYYLALGAGIYCILLASLQKRILGIKRVK